MANDQAVISFGVLLKDENSLFMFRCLNSLKQKADMVQTFAGFNCLSISFSAKLSSEEVSFINEM